MTPAPGRALSSACERFPLPGDPERWIEFLELEHGTLPPAIEYFRESGELVIRREPIDARPLGERGVPAAHRAALLLQGAAAAAFFSAHGFSLSVADVEAACWDVERDCARLWLACAPESVRAQSGSAETPASAAVASLLRRLFPRSRRIPHPGARALLERLTSEDAAWKRPEFWVAGALRAFPELRDPGAAPARRRCLGIRGDALRSLRARALAAHGRALLRGALPRRYEAASALTPWGVLGAGEVRDAAEAVRFLRERTERGGAGQREVWIAVNPERWDPLSRRALEAAAAYLQGRVELVRVEEAATQPESPADWRRAVWVPCGTVAASIRFYEAFAERAGAGSIAPVELARSLLGGVEWAAFVADPTGDAPVPSEGILPPPERDSHSHEHADADGGLGDSDRGARVERLLEEGRAAEAIREARRWMRDAPGKSLEAWFPLVARLRAASPDASVPWLEALEAEREVSGGRVPEARVRLERVLRSSAASAEDRRAAGLRLAELAVALGQAGEGALRAAAWRRENPGAPAGELARALRLGAFGLAREGRFDCALALVDDADRVGASLPAAERVETALARARVHALAGRFDEEEAVYESVRALALGSGDESVAGRFLAQEGRRLLDRRESARAILRLEEALALFRDDPAEKAGLLLDLAATHYHAGDPERSEALLTRSLEAAAAAGREDLARIARGNRIELRINRCAWEIAAAEIAALEASARSDRDDSRLLVALHHRSRLALRRGLLAPAAADNARARELAARLCDRLEIGELWLEDGDRRLYEGDTAGAREAWGRAAEDPPDRCASDAAARDRLRELDSLSRDGPSEEARAELDALFARDGYRGAETVARWQCILGGESLPRDLRERAEIALRDGGGEALADRVFGDGTPAVRNEALRGLRHAMSAAMSGEDPDGHRELGLLGLAGLAVRDAGGREVARLGTPAGPDAEPEWRELAAGSARFELALWPPASAQAADSIAMILETLLFRPPAASAPSDFAEGWSKLGITTADPSMEEPYRRLARFAPQPVTVLILGASGCGKEAVARAVHLLSPRTSGPFVAVNVPAIPAALLESELFGHSRGSFTGADRDRRGLLEEAAGGTIFFDEIGDLPLPLQSKLLRALQEREIRRVGENRARPIDARVVSATSRDLAERVESGQFREDLFYRLHVAVIRLPPLRERGRDPAVLARYFLQRFAREYGRGALRLTPEAAAAIAAYPWPGNVRELQNAIAQAVALCDADGSVELALLPERVRDRNGRGEASGDYRSRVDSHRRELIAGALDRAGGNRSRAARELGLSRQALHYLIRELGVPAGRKSESP